MVQAFSELPSSDRRAAERYADNYLNRFGQFAPMTRSELLETYAKATPAQRQELLR